MALLKPTCEPKSLESWSPDQPAMHYKFCIFHWFLTIWIGILVIPLAGCASLADPEAAQIHYQDEIATLNHRSGYAHSSGQTFTSPNSGLDSVTLWLASQTTPGDPEPILSFALFHQPEDRAPLFQASYRLPNTDFKGPFRVTFPPRVDPPGQTYYARITIINGAIQVRGRSEDTYPFGQAQLDDLWIPGDLSFSLTYRYSVQHLGEDIARALQGIWLVFPLFATLLLPGWLWLNLTRTGKGFAGWNRISLSAGLSLALLPLVMLWTGMAGLHWKPGIVRIFFWGLALLAGWSSLRKIAKPWWKKIRLSDFALVGIVSLSFLVRLAMARDLAFPPWVDSVHHAYITSLVQESGSLPGTYQPYFDAHPTAYHPGYHSGLAVFQWLSGLPMPEAMIVYGQALNLLAVLAASSLARALTRSEWASVGAALAAGLLLPLPAYLTSWGRYTHLAGLIILAAVLGVTERMAMRKPFLDFKNLPGWSWLLQAATGGIALAGLFLVHYRVAAFAVCWWIADWLVSLGAKKILFSKSFTFLVVASLGLLLCIPWFLPALQFTFLPRFPLTDGELPSLFGDFDASILTAATGWLALFLAGAGLFFGVIRRTRMAVALVGWIIGMFILANLGALGLPGGSFINNVSVEITLMVPLSLLAGFGVAQLTMLSLAFFPDRLLNVGRILFIMVGTTLAVVGSARLIPILNPTTVLAKAADYPAMKWIKQHIPSEETILINSFQWGDGLCAGSDGGYWILPLTGNNTLPPPLLYGMESAEKRGKILSACQEIRANGGDPAALKQLLDQLKIKYVYTGSRGGGLSSHALSQSPFFFTLYHKESVWIFQTVP